MSPAPENAPTFTDGSHHLLQQRDGASTPTGFVSGALSSNTADAAGASRANGLAGVLAELASHLRDQPTTQAVMEQAAAAAVIMVPGTADAAITLHRRRAIDHLAATSDRARRFQELQSEVGQGPSLEAALQRRSVQVMQLTHEVSRWPLLAARAGELAQVAALCLPLSSADRLVGTLTLLTDGTNAFGQDAERIAVLLCAHAAVAATAAQSLDQLHRALEHRNTIGMAKGILMERLKISADHAFDLLLRASRDSNRKLHEVAADLVQTGDLRN